MAIPKTETGKKKDVKKHNANASHGAEHGKLPPHDGPPKEPDPATITTETAEPQGEGPAIGRKPRSGTKPRQLTDSDRIAILEHRLEALGRQLRTHGIHIPHDVAVESTED